MEFITNYFNEIQRILEHMPRDEIGTAIDILHDARLRGHKVFIMGNGGSAATASHFACDLAKNARRQGQPLMQVLALSDNMAMFSAYANDDGYENVFVRQLAPALLQEDVVVAISTSGNSANVLKAANLGKKRSAKVIGLTGFDGGKLASIVDVNLHIKSDCIEHIEDLHLLLCHLMTTALKELPEDLEEQKESFQSYAFNGSADRPTV